MFPSSYERQSNVQSRLPNCHDVVNTISMEIVVTMFVVSSKMPINGAYPHSAVRASTSIESLTCDDGQA